MNVQFKGNNPMQTLQQKAADLKKVAQQKQLGLQQLKADTFQKKADPKFGGSCCH